MIDSSAAYTAISSDLCPRDLQLRVRGGQHGGRLVRLVGNRLTIGSAPYSSLRLLAPGIRPTHCLIVRGRQGAVIRHWNGDARLNGKSFTDEWLRPGDLLRLGSVELEVTADRTVPSFHEAAAISATPPIDDDKDELARPVNDDKDEPTPPSDDISTERFQGRLQLLLEHQRQLSERERDLENRQTDFESERQQWSHEREAELAELDAREECLRALREEIEATRKSNSRDEEWTQERERLLAKLQQTQQERDEWKRMVDEMSGPQHADWDQPTTVSESDSPSDLSTPHAEVHLGVTDPAESATVSRQTTAEPATQPEVPSPATQDGDEFSIEAYMSQLLQRVGGRPAESVPNESTPPARKPAAQPPPAMEPKPTKPVEQVDADPELSPAPGRCRSTWGLCGTLPIRRPAWPSSAMRGASGGRRQRANGSWSPSRRSRPVVWFIGQHTGRRRPDSDSSPPAWWRSSGQHRPSG